MTGKPIDLTGQRFGKLIVIAQAPNRGLRVVWHCKCDCGRLCVVAAQQLRGGITTKCVPLYKPQQPSILKLGFDRRVRRAWENMRVRCYDPKHQSFPHYGGRGIAVCDRWRDDFVAFAKDMGPKPGPGYTLDRIDPDGDYEPANCRWADQMTQAANKRNAYRVVDGDNTYSLSAFASLMGMSRYRAYRRAKGWKKGAAIPASEARKALAR